MGVGKLVVFDGKMGMRKFRSAAPPSSKVACDDRVISELFVIYSLSINIIRSN